MGVVSVAPDEKGRAKTERGFLVVFVLAVGARLRCTIPRPRAIKINMLILFSAEELTVLDTLPD
jgi:hypothetical protein